MSTGHLCICSFTHKVKAGNRAGCSEHQRREAEGAKLVAPGFPASLGKSYYPPSPLLSVPSFLPLKGQSSHLILPSTLSCITYFPLHWVIPNTIKHAIIFPILRKESSLYHVFLFPGSLFLFPWTAKLPERVIVLSPLPFLQCLLSTTPIRLLPPCHSIKTVLVTVSRDPLVLNSMLNSQPSLYLSYVLSLTPGVPFSLDLIS